MVVFSIRTNSQNLPSTGAFEEAEGEGPNFELCQYQGLWVKNQKNSKTEKKVLYYIDDLLP